MMANRIAGVSVSLSHNYLRERAADATSPIGREILGPDAPGPFRSDRYIGVLRFRSSGELRSRITATRIRTWIRCVT